MKNLRKRGARVWSSIISIAMISIMMSTPVLTSMAQITNCHSEHNEECGYVQWEKGMPCSHWNEDGTYSCMISDDDEKVTPSNAKKKAICHHDDDCGYIEETEGKPCTHICELCQPSSDSDTALNVPNKNRSIEKITEEMGTLSVRLSARDSKVVLSPQSSEEGYDYYYKTTSSDDTENKPEVNSTDLTDFTKYSNSTEIAGMNGTIVFVQVIKVSAEGENKIKAWGQASATPIALEVPSGYTSDAHKIMAYRFTNNSNLDIQGVYDGLWKQTTYGNGGFSTYFMLAGGQPILVGMTGNKETITGVPGITLETNVDFLNQGKLLKITYELKNESQNPITYSLGSAADVQIGADDYAKITKLENDRGFMMVSSKPDDKNINNEYAQFNFFGRSTGQVSDVTNFWYGRLISRETMAFLNDSDIRDGSYDAGMGYSWKDKTIESNETQSYSVLIGIGGAGSESEGDIEEDTEEKDQETSTGGGSSGVSRVSIWLPPNHVGGTKLINNVRVPDYVMEGLWSKDENGTWNFTDKEGTQISGNWAAIFNPHADLTKGQSAFNWFQFDSNGKMITGWYVDTDGNSYYLNTNSDNILGSMCTGWATIDNKYYYFNNESDGNRGKLLKNTTTPDGYHVDENGVYINRE